MTLGWLKEPRHNYVEYSWLWFVLEIIPKTFIAASGFPHVPKNTLSWGSLNFPSLQYTTWLHVKAKKYLSYREVVSAIRIVLICNWNFESVNNNIKHNGQYIDETLTGSLVDQTNLSYNHDNR